MENIPGICNNCKGYETEGCYLSEVQARANYRPFMIITVTNVLRNCTATDVKESVRNLIELDQSLETLNADTQRRRADHEGTLELGVYNPFARDPTE